MNREEIEQRLLEVRKAYRIVHAYQRRVLDMLEEVDGWLQATLHLRFRRWGPNYWNRPAEAGTAPFGRRWAWDMLPALSFWTAWNGVKDGTARHVVLSIESDGWPHRNLGREPEVEDLPPPEGSISRLIVRCDVVGAPSADWNAFWNELRTQPDWTSRRVTFSLGGARCVSEVILRVSLAEIVDPESLREKVLAPVEKWFAANAPVGESR